MILEIPKDKLLALLERQLSLFMIEEEEVKVLELYLDDVLERLNHCFKSNKNK